MSGRLGKGVALAGAWTLAYSVPSNNVATANIRVLNRSTTLDTFVAVAVSNSNTAAGAGIVDGEYITDVLSLSKNGGMYEDIAIAASAGECVWIKSTAADVNYRVHGFEKAA